MIVTSFVAAVAPRTGKIIKDGLSGFERAFEKLLKNGILHSLYLD